MDVSREQVIAYRLAAQGLHRDGPIERLAVLDIGVQHGGPESVRLAFDARLADPPPELAIGPGHRLAFVWSFRGAPYVHRRADLNRLAGALWPMSEADAVARLDAAASVRKAGIDALAAYELTVEALRAAVDRPMGKGEASTAVTGRVPEALTRECRPCHARHVYELPFRMGVLPAGLELELQSPPLLEPRARAKPAVGFDPRALRQVIVDYLTVLGPAGPAEVAGYLEARRADLAEHWPGDLAEVRVDGRPAWLPRRQLGLLGSPPAPELVRLLGGFDPWLQARDRRLIAPDRSVHKQLWPVLGRPGVVLVDGEVLGVWRPKSSGRKLTLTVSAFAPLPPAVWTEIEAEAQRVAAVRGAESVVLTRSA